MTEPLLNIPPQSQKVHRPCEWLPHKPVQALRGRQPDGATSTYWLFILGFLVCTLNRWWRNSPVRVTFLGYTACLGSLVSLGRNWLKVVLSLCF